MMLNLVNLKMVSGQKKQEFVFQNEIINILLKGCLTFSYLMHDILLSPQKFFFVL